MIDFFRRYFPGDTFECLLCQKAFKLTYQIVCCGVEYLLYSASPIVKSPGPNQHIELKLRYLHYKNLNFTNYDESEPKIRVFIKAQQIHIIMGSVLKREEMLRMQKLALLVQ